MFTPQVGLRSKTWRATHGYAANHRHNAVPALLE
jgi:hypothetical protein